MSQPPGEIDPYEKYRAEAIEGDKKEKESSPKGLSALGAYFLYLLQKFLELFQEVTEKGLSSANEKELRKTLLIFKESLEIMKREDRSQDGPFLNQFANQWHQLLEDALKFQKSTLFSNNYTSLIKEIETYPEKTEHSLGYYLMEHAGREWLPFPFMELVQKIHTDHQKNPLDSPLSRWTAQIDSLLASLH